MKNLLTLSLFLPISLTVFGMEKDPRDKAAEKILFHKLRAANLYLNLSADIGNYDKNALMRRFEERVESGKCQELRTDVASTKGIIIDRHPLIRQMMISCDKVQHYRKKVIELDNPNPWY